MTTDEDWLAELILEKVHLYPEEVDELASVLRKAIDERLPKLKEVGSLSSAIDEQEYRITVSKMFGWNAAINKVRKVLGLPENKKEDK